MFKLVLLKTMETRFVFEFSAILARHEIYQKCLLLLMSF